MFMELNSSITRYNSLFLNSVLSNLKRAIDLGGFGEEFFTYLSRPMRTISINIPVKINGSIRIYEGYRVQHNNALGPYKGGIRFHPEVTLEDDMALATIMTLKNSLNGLPYGGAKGAIRIDPSKVSKEELEAVSRGYARALVQFIGPDIDIPAPDLNTNPQIMAWMVDEYSKMMGRNVPATFTAKPVQLWGNPVREYSTGYGAALWTRNAARKFLKGIEGATVAVQGFGNVGYWLSHFLTEMGAKVVAIGDIGGAIYNSNGFNPDEVKAVERKTGTVVNYTGPGTRKIGMDELLTLNVDILVPAAVEGVINYSNANAVKAKLIMEAANGPVTSDAEEMLYKRGIYVFPDIGVNAGGVVMSYLEWVENLQWFIWDEEETKKKLDFMITNAFNRVYDRWQKMNGATIRDAAYIDALDRIYQAMKWRGWI